MTIKVYQGEREMASGNKSLGEFNLEGIPPAPRGTPQIEVSFDIDANGILHVGAKDKGTGKENKITIKANSGLTEDEIQKMVKDAEAERWRGQTRRSRNWCESRNQGDALVHSTSESRSPSIRRQAGSRREGQRSKRSDQGRPEEGAIKSGDKSDIDAKTAALMTSAAQKLGEKMYADMPKARKQARLLQPARQAASSPSKPNRLASQQPQQDDNVVDADFKEVKDAK